MAEIYKIRSATTGLYSSGGNSPKFTKTGKVWRARNHLTCHLNQLDRHGRHTYEQNNAYIETIEIQEVVASTESVSDYIKERDRIRQEHERQLQQAREEADRKRRKEQYDKLHKEFG
ncbi:MAG: hypothetical protein EO766_12305 [Hydrotalea sp. AMD]|uniref:hypothetical protein n=1 Tax=Hydrotalea sp. AMD TaxID=2501297 RepID=UPI0010277A69|nr:hypothetical protein [Hydrotalea sp. AMD]RWZ87300.1 MAG: hypothetical protein EO766_12305 [Hydrotalea sp. AMD]